MDTQSLKHYCAAAVEAAESAATLIKAYQRSGDWTVSHKSDESPVTEVDVAAEMKIKEVLAGVDGNIGFYGEETGKVGSTDRCWLVDPIDGTKSFVRGMRYFSTQIALLDQNEYMLGVSNAPDYGEQLVAIHGEGARLGGVACRVRDITSVADAYLSTGNLKTLASTPAAWTRLAALVTRVKRVRGYGDFCHYHQLCSGQADIIVESDVNILDIAALSVAVREAGGVITDLQGADIGLQTTSVLAAANEQLHASVLALLSEPEG